MRRHGYRRRPRPAHDKARSQVSDKRYSAAHDKAKELTVAATKFSNEACKRARANQRYDWQSKDDAAWYVNRRSLFREIEA
jgi:hypothetical protein